MHTSHLFVLKLFLQIISLYLFTLHIVHQWRIIKYDFAPSKIHKLHYANGALF